MSERYFEILRDVCLTGNCIPSGRQLPRTPPLTDVKRHLDFSTDDINVEDLSQDPEAPTRDKDDHDQHRMFSISPHETEPGELNSKLKGMKGYQLTPGDLEFIKKMEEEKILKTHQKELEAVLKLLRKETEALERVRVLKKNAQAEFSKFPSCEDLAEWVKAVLQMTSPSADLTDLDTRSLLAAVTTHSIQTAMDRKKTQLTQMKNMVANKRKKEAEERGRLEKVIASEQLKIQGMMSQLTDLKSELEQQEELCKALQTQIKKQEELKVDAEKVDVKGPVKSGARERKKAVKFSDKAQEAAKQNNKVKPAGSKRTGSKTDDLSAAKGEVNESIRTGEQAEPKAQAPSIKTTRAAKSSRLPQNKAEDQDSNSQNTVKGRRKPPGATGAAASQPKTQHKAKTGEARPESHQTAPARSRKKNTTVAAGDAEEEAENPGLRRSRRIASKR